MRAGRRLDDVDDPAVGRVRADRLAVFTIDRVFGLDGDASPGFLVDCDVFLAAISGAGLFSFASPVKHWTEYVDYNICAGGSSNDDRFTADCGQSRLVLTTWQTIIHFPLE
jgi:hypothetical protein